MKKNKISTYIRLQNSVRLIIPLAIIVVILLTVKKLGVTSYLFPKYVPSDKLDELESEFAKTTLNGLHYTGFNCTSRGKIKGGYYYYFRETTCCFVVISPNKKGELPDYIESITVTGRITENPDELRELTELLAKEINWNSKDLSAICDRKILNQTLYHKKLTKWILYTLFLLFSIGAANLLFLFLGIIFPHVSLANMRNGNYLKLRRILKNAQEEMNTNIRYAGNNMFITDNYFINMSFRNVVVIPLEKIVWAYYHSVLHKKIFFKHTITYTLRLVTDDKTIYSVPHKSKEKCMEAMDVISTMYPEILIGYSEENHLNFLSRINSVLSALKQKVTKNED